MIQLLKRRGDMAAERNSFKMGTVEMLVLSLLSQKDLYGYEISMLLRDISEGRFVVPEGSLYPVLYKLEDNHHITVRELRTGKRRVRKYYHIEKEGHARLANLLADYKEISKGIDLILDASVSNYEVANDD